MVRAVPKTFTSNTALMACSEHISRGAIKPTPALHTVGYGAGEQVSHYPSTVCIQGRGNPAPILSVPQHTHPQGCSAIQAHPHIGFPAPGCVLGKVPYPTRPGAAPACSAQPQPASAGR